MTKSQANVLIALMVVLIGVVLSRFISDAARDEVVVTFSKPDGDVIFGTKIAQQKAATIRQQISIYLMNNNLSTVPDDFEVSELTTGANAPLEPKDVVDPWGREFIVVWDDVGWQVVSYGADGEPGGGGVNADIMD